MVLFMGITYSQVYDSSELRGIEEIRPWDIQEILRRFWKPEMTVLDVGCGTCAKTAWMSVQSKEFIALDPNPEMREAARERLSVAKGRIRVIGGTSDKIPLSTASISLLVSILAPPDVEEFARVLANGSLCIVEILGENDKRALKEAFPPDASGLRGQLTEFTYPERQLQIKEQLNKYFEPIAFFEGQWKSYFTRPQLELLLSQTNTIRNFSVERDRKILDELEKAYPECIYFRIIVISLS